MLERGLLGASGNETGDCMHAYAHIRIYACTDPLSFRGGSGNETNLFFT